MGNTRKLSTAALSPLPSGALITILNEENV